MSYIALARKWRPQTFTEMVGQTHVTRALSNALDRSRLHHAYLFTGTRGVGKTSVARLFAKALSCEKGPSATPCLQCEACTSIAQARYIDLIEIDAASRTRVEDTRELLENVSYSPTQGRFKIYLIDEVHMLSTHSFNALLKTLEEPPEHVKFLLATTEPQKLPMTVRSRCLQFHLTALDETEIETHLAHILKEEKIKFEEAALKLIAKAAHGSVRDALSLLDQMIMLSKSAITEKEVKHALGFTQKDYSPEILNALADSTAEKLLSISQAIQKEGGQYQHVLDELLQALHQISCAKALNQSTAFDNFSPEDIQLFYEISLKGREALELAPTMAVGFEMTLLRLYAFKPAGETLAKPAPPQTQKVKEQLQIKEQPPVAKEKPQSNNWEEILPELKLTGLALNAAQHATLAFETDTKAQLVTHQKHASLFTDNTIQKIEKALSSYYERKIKLSVKRDTETPSSPAEKKRVQKVAQKAADEALLDEDKAFQALKETFSSE